MRVLHLAAGNRWTGAAAPAFAEVEALREAGIEAHYAYVGGYKLEERLRGVEYAHPVIGRAQNPISFAGTVASLRRLAASLSIDIVHAHLTYDHWLARFMGGGARLARTFHSQRTLRRDPLTRALMSHTDVVAVVNDTFRNAALLQRRETHFTPPPLDVRQFNAAGPNVRPLYEIADETPLMAVIGKVSPGRGFEAALETFALVLRSAPAAKLLIVGHGPHRARLEELAGQLGIGRQVIWAGYHEDDLADHYRAADVLLFTAAGSDEGHRAVIEAMACGVTPATYPIPGVAALLGSALAPQLVAPTSDRHALAAVVGALLARRGSLRGAVTERAAAFAYDRAAERLGRAYRMMV